MKKSADRIAYLLTRLLRQEASEAEKAELENWEKTSPSHKAIVEEALQPGFVLKGLQEMAVARKKMDQILLANGVPLVLDKEPKVVPLPRVPVWKKSWVRYAAAVILLLAGWGVYRYTTPHPANPVLVSATRRAAAENIRPGWEHARLQLKDGSLVQLDSTVKGNITMQGQVKLLNTGGLLTYTAVKPLNSGGRLTYTASTHLAAVTGFNTLTTPKGGLYRLVLADGTRVWLNAGSSLSYPVAFTANERIVNLQGEGYFEVKHITGANGQPVPFRVKINKTTQVEVTGTHFNIHAYPDETSVNTVLLEGRVRVGVTDLLPGQEARVNNKGVLLTVKKADREEAIAWKNGFFYFRQAGITTILGQLSRWYDVEVEYHGSPPVKEFTGQLLRSAPFTQVLTILKTYGIHYRLQHRKLIILP